MTRRRPPIVVQTLASIGPLARNRIIQRSGDAANSPIWPDKHLRPVGEAVVSVTACRDMLRPALSNQGRIDLSASQAMEASDA